MADEYNSEDDISGVFEGPLDLSSVVPSEPARVIAGRYEIVERIGEGAMGQVVRARHLRLGKPFAIKLMTAEFLDEPESRAIFDREARLASALSHPCIVSVVDFGEDPDWGLFIVMELVEGETLSQRIDDAGPLPVEIVCDVGAQLADALHHSHVRDVVHGDLKSDNVVCVEPTEDERRRWGIKLLDFGMAHVASAYGGREERVAGTPEYLAPERIRGELPAPPIDIYALGVILYEMLAGSVPFGGDDPTAILERQLRATPEPVAARRGEALDPALVAIVERAMAKDPADRFANARTIGRELTAYMQTRGMHRRQKRRPTTSPGISRTSLARTAFDALGVPAAGLDTNGTILVANAALAELLRRDHPEVIEGTSVLDTALARLHPGLREDVRLVAMDAKVVRRGITVERKSGARTAMRLVLTPTADAAVPCVLAVYTLPPAKRQR